MATRTFLIPFGGTADNSIDYLIGILKDARTTTLQRVEGLSTAELDWQYKEGWNTIGCLLSHIIACEHYFRIVYLEGRQLTEAENEQWLPGLDLGECIPQLICQRPIAYYIEELAKARQLVLSALQSVSFQTFSERIDGYDAQTGCNRAWVLYHMAEDEVHHRGQISLLRKLQAELPASRGGLNKVKRTTKPPVFKPGEYRLSYFVHQLEVGQTHFIKKEEWVSKKSPSERLRRLKQRTNKHFQLRRKADGTGWDVERTA